MTHTFSSHDPRMLLAVSAAREAGQATLQWFRQPTLEVERKQDDSPVTCADRAAEELLRRRVVDAFPEDAVLGEEFGEKSGTSGFRWVLDPIDGTKSFISGVALYTTLVAVLHNEEPYVGVIYSPATDEIVYAKRGEPAWYSQGQASPVLARVDEVATLAEATFLTSDVGSFQRDRTPEAKEVYEALATQCRLCRTWGDGYGYLMVATGRAHLMVDPVMNLWDAAALQPVIEGAGGVFCDWQGVSTPHSGEGVACSRRLLDSVLAVTRKSPRRHDG